MAGTVLLAWAAAACEATEPLTTAPAWEPIEIGLDSAYIVQAAEGFGDLGRHPCKDGLDLGFLSVLHAKLHF
jgi:hypothetical protein